MSCEPRWQDRVAAGVADELDEAGWRALRTHLAACRLCRAFYDQVSAAVAMLEGRPGLPTEAARAAGRGALLDVVAPEASPAASDQSGDAGLDEAAPAVLAPAPPAPRRRTGWLVGLAAALVFVAAVVAWRAEPAPTRPWLVARGAASPTISFKVFCVDVAGEAPRVRSVAAPLGRPAACTPDDRLQFTWSSRTVGPQSVRFFAVRDGALLPVWPPAPTPVVGPAADQPLPGAFALPRPGRYRILAVTGTPDDVGAVEAWWALGGGDLGLLPGQVLEAEVEVQ